ncbi:MAG: flavodoxin family protein [Bacillota bacterium]
MKAVVFYYSYSGKTKLVAEALGRSLRAEVREIKEVKKRGVLGAYFFGGRDALRGKSSEIQPCNTDLKGFDMVLIGTPIWAGRPTPAVNALLAKLDFTGKKVGAFVTLGGIGLASALKAFTDSISSRGGKVAATASYRSMKIKKEAVDGLIQEFAAKLTKYQ